MPLDPKKIRAVMDAKGITQTELSCRTGIATPNISRILSGERTNPSLSTAERIAAALKTTIVDLIEIGRI